MRKNYEELLEKSKIEDDEINEEINNQLSNEIGFQQRDDNICFNCERPLAYCICDERREEE